MKRVRRLGKSMIAGSAVATGALLLPTYTASAAAPITIQVWSIASDSPSQPNANGAGYKAMVSHYEALHPNIKIQWTTYPAGQNPSTYQSLLTAIAGNRAPNIAEIDRFTVAEFALKGALEPITKYATSTLTSLDKKVPGATQELHGFDGQMYGVPAVFDNVGFWSLYYNKTLLAKAGVKAPPKTWSELVADAKKLTVINNGKIVQLGYEPYGDTAGELDSMLYAAQGHLISADGKTSQMTNSKVITAVSEIQKVMDAEGGYKKVLAFMPPASAPPNMDPFLQGKSAMYDMGDWEIQTIAALQPNLNYGVVFLPTPTGKEPAAWAGGWSFQMTKNASNPGETYDFLQYLTSADAATPFIKGAQAYGVKHHELVVLPGAVYFAYPDLAQRYNLPTLKQYPNLYQSIEHFLTAEQYASHIYARDRNVVPSELWLAEQNAVQNVLYGKMNVMQSLQQQNQIIQTAINNMSNQ